MAPSKIERLWKQIKAGNEVQQVYGEHARDPGGHSALPLRPAASSEPGVAEEAVTVIALRNRNL